MPLRLLVYISCIIALSILRLPANGQRVETSCNGMQITGFKIFNYDLPIDSIRKLETIELTNEQNSFSVRYTLTDSADATVYYYRLQGKDKEWTRASNSGVINYVSLRPGKYSFEIRCKNTTAGVERDYNVLRVDINLPFWLSGWFILLCFLVFVGAVYYLHSAQIKRLMAVERVRQKVSRDLHDDIGSTLSTINILSVMARSKMKEDPEKALEYINKISDNSTRMMEAMDDIVWSIHPANDNLNKVLARMRSFATEVLEPKDIDLILHFDEALKDIHLDMEQRRDLFLLFKEAINNAAKYSQATEVRIDMHLESKTLELSVRDNGIGFDVEKADSGNGLNNMQKRAEKQKWVYSIFSEVGKGTSIVLRIKLN
jgi:signal transduction histidine kinase